ncbi:MAG: leucine-rich repeat domain-containing protein [Bacteroidaceae bacterium]|nr:leucine-rich repeat domain-containing protein [Bacteroidaceae bacterium]
MKKLTSLVLVFLTSLFSLTSWAAERVAPTFPEPQTLESGKTYYLYNVGSGQFLYRDNSMVRASKTSGTGIIITETGDGTYTMQFCDNNSYIWTSSSDLNTQSGVDSDVYFRFNKVDGGYTIQRNKNYNETHFVANNSSYSVYANQTDGNIVWQLLDAAEGSYFIAKKALYDALESAEVNYAWAIADFEAIYENEASTIVELNAATTALQNSFGMSTGYQAPWWNERPILFSTSDGSFGQNDYYTWALPNNSYTSGTYFERYLGNSGQTSSISATVLIEEPSTLIYSLSDNPPSLDVYVDGELVRRLGDEQCNHEPYTDNNAYTRFFEELEPGLHTITWTLSALAWKGYASVYLRNVGVMSKQQIIVNLLEPGSLGTEVLYNTDHIKNVRRLKVKGAMNSDDWAKIKMMSTLLELDLSEAQFAEIPTQQFRLYGKDTTMVFLHKVVLPEGLTKINSEAFYNSFVEEVNFPSTLQNIGYRAFCMSHILEAILPDNLTEMGEDVFEDAYWLKKAHFGKNLITIPRDAFYYCYYLSDVILPEKLRTVDTYAFKECHSLQTSLPEGLETVGSRAFEGCWNFNPRLPEGLTTIRNAAFNTCNALDSLFVPSSVTTIEEYAFCNCQNLKYAELSVSQYTTPYAIFDNTPQLEVLKLNSATVVDPIISGSTYPHRNISQLTLKVPHYLVNSYKLHSYWYNAKAIEPFDYSSIDYIPIHGQLTLNHERFGGQPSVDVHNKNSYLKVNGDAAQAFEDFRVWRDFNDEWGYGMMLSNCQNLSINGDAYVMYKTQANRWNFISLPFDLDISRIAHNQEGVQFAIRYYDGEGRAANGMSGNWKNVDRTGIIPAGTGFILQSNKDCWTSLYAVNNETKQNIVSCREFNKTLAVNASETASNKGWNLVGNPYQCFYNNHALNFTAPITIWNPDRKTYTAYSLTDDDYAIRPNEAFFVQCPNEEYNTIGFPLQGRQLTSVIESQNAVKEWAPQAKTRQVVNLTVASGEMEDMTRVVLNEEASLAYETACDASKFMSMDGSVPQIYTLDAEGTQYAINERPFAEGTVALGFYTGQDGDYTISTSRCDAEKVFITDNLTGTTTDITDGAYTFSAKAGTDNTRFTLSFVSNDPTAVREVEKDAIMGKADIYSVDGKFLGNDASRLEAGIYVVRQGKKASKVIVR